MYKVDRLTLPNHKNYCKSTIMGAMWYCHKDRQMDQQSGIEVD